ELGLGEPFGLDGAERELHRGVAVAFGRLELHDATGPGLDDGDRDDPVVRVPDLCHAELAPEDPLAGHGGASFLRLVFVRLVLVRSRERSPGTGLWADAGGASSRLCHAGPTGLRGRRLANSVSRVGGSAGLVTLGEPSQPTGRAGQGANGPQTCWIL